MSYSSAKSTHAANLSSSAICCNIKKQNSSRFIKSAGTNVFIAVSELVEHGRRRATSSLDVSALPDLRAVASSRLARRREGCLFSPRRLPEKTFQRARRMTTCRPPKSVYKPAFGITQGGKDQSNRHQMFSAEYQVNSHLADKVIVSRDTNLNTLRGCRGGVVARLLVSKLVRFPTVSLLDFRTLWESCRTMPLVGGFSRGSPVSHHFIILALLYTHLTSPSSALKTSMFRAVQISTLTHSIHRFVEDGCGRRFVTRSIKSAGVELSVDGAMWECSDGRKESIPRKLTGNMQSSPRLPRASDSAGNRTRNVVRGRCAKVSNIAAPCHVQMKQRHCGGDLRWWTERMVGRGTHLSTSQIAGKCHPLSAWSSEGRTCSSNPSGACGCYSSFTHDVNSQIQALFIHPQPHNLPPCVGWRDEKETRVRLQTEVIRDGASFTGNRDWGRNGKESAMAFVRDPSQHSHGVISENHGKPKSGWPDRVLPNASRIRYIRRNVGSPTTFYWLNHVLVRVTCLRMSHEDSVSELRNPEWLGRGRTRHQQPMELQGRGDRAVSALASHQDEPGSIPGRVTGLSHVGIVSDDAVGRRVFSGISRFPRPFIPTLFHTHRNHPRRLSNPASCAVLHRQLLYFTLKLVTRQAVRKRHTWFAESTRQFWHMRCRGNTRGLGKVNNARDATWLQSRAVTASGLIGHARGTSVCLMFVRREWAPRPVWRGQIVCRAGRECRVVAGCRLTAGRASRTPDRWLTNRLRQGRSALIVETLSNSCASMCICTCVFKHLSLGPDRSKLSGKHADVTPGSRTHGTPVGVPYVGHAVEVMALAPKAESRVLCRVATTSYGLL
ncbi:hypothetical protein PR048_025062 [Dryococelus australis]|uniref:Uncharacterized protein n=1 Tax=Dryococelus australis TaxID=614101 RepID=A0ABQ9GQB3_9NEOP|nr:hypothetical protein PR048_025062 [Dryococelus australis]